jgi:threonyl-tRNA synthetase
MEKYLGDKATWKQAEATLENFVKSKKAKYTIALGEAAFYGPKIDFIAKDWASRPFQVATIQLDYNMPERFDLTCVNEQGEKERIVMMHCAVMGSIERAMAMLIEHFAGWFPLWLAPVQVKVLPISKAQNKYASLAVKELLKQIPDLRIEIDDSNESIGKKIREASMQKIPYLLIAGEKEVKAKKLSVRKKDKDLGSLAIKKLAESLKKEISTKAIK